MASKKPDASASLSFSFQLQLIVVIDLGLATLIPEGEVSKKLIHTSYVFTFFFLSFALKQVWRLYKKKKLISQLRDELFWRRKRDSNPRRCDPQRFSRPPHSTTLPFLRCKSTIFFNFTNTSMKIF